MVMAKVAPRNGNGEKRMAKLRSRLGILIAEYRHTEGKRLTQKELAKATKLSENTISRLINNDFTQIEADTIERLCTFFDLDDLDDLLVIVRD